MANRKTSTIKKKEKPSIDPEGEANSNPTCPHQETNEQMQLDHEVFLQTFVKPSQIYRILR